jgi:tetratricopeptide (TPR) repeat protein
MSQLLLRLEREIQTSESPDSIATAQAQRAAYLARVGRFQEAKESIALLRRTYGDGRNGAVTVWIMLAEGLAQLYENLQPHAIDRIKRAQLLSKLLEHRELWALSSAWKAHIEFETSQYTAMFESLALALEKLDASNSAAGSRICMVIADAHFLCGDDESGHKWFMQSRVFALNDGDQATIDALLYNRAAFRMSRLRSESCFAPVNGERLSRIRTETMSAKNYQDMTRISALSDFIALSDARLSVVEGKYESAVVALTSVRSSRQFASYNFSEALVDLETAYCLEKLGRRAEALDVFPEKTSLNLENLDIDEQLRACWTLCELAARSKDFGDAALWGERFEAVSGTYASTIASLNAGLQKLRMPQVAK